MRSIEDAIVRRRITALRVTAGERCQSSRVKIVRQRGKLRSLLPLCLLCSRPLVEIAPIRRSRRAARSLSLSLSLPRFSLARHENMHELFEIR